MVNFPITVIATDTEPVVRYIRALNAEILRLQVENETMRSICDAAFTATRHDAWRKGVVFDPFVGSGTTLLVATGNDRDAIGVDLDPRNAQLARERCGMFLTVEGEEFPGPVEQVEPPVLAPVAGDTNDDQVRVDVSVLQLFVETDRQ